MRATMSAGEYARWEEHFAKYPPHGRLAEQLLATLCCFASQWMAAHAKEGSKPAVLQLHDLLPYVESPEEKRAKRTPAQIEADVQRELNAALRG